MARKYHRIISTLAVGGLLAAFAPGAYAASATELGTKYETLDESLWSCVWNDEFDGSSVDTTKWSYTVGGGGFGNNEQQYYTDSASNSYIQDGCLVSLSKNPIIKQRNSRPRLQKSKNISQKLASKGVSTPSLQAFSDSWQQI